MSHCSTKRGSFGATETNICGNWLILKTILPFQQHIGLLDEMASLEHRPSLRFRRKKLFPCYILLSRVQVRWISCCCVREENRPSAKVAALFWPWRELGELTELTLAVTFHSWHCSLIKTLGGLGADQCKDHCSSELQQHHGTKNSGVSLHQGSGSPIGWGLPLSYVTFVREVLEVARDSWARDVVPTPRMLQGFPTQQLSYPSRLENFVNAPTRCELWNYDQ